jgi:hypothetical protein
VHEYRRPNIEEQVFLDDDGHPIPYGRRWDSTATDKLPMHLVSRYADQERFLPISTTAEALLEYLVSAFMVSIQNDLAHGEVFDATDREAYGGLNRVVRITPDAHDQAPLTVGFHGEPGRISVAAGCFSSFDLWFCGCDLCDDDWRDTAESLETIVLAVAAGGLVERIGRGPWGSARYTLEAGDVRPWTGIISKRSFPAAALRTYRQVLDRLPRGAWSAYAPR